MSNVKYTSALWIPPSPQPHSSPPPRPRSQLASHTAPAPAARTPPPSQTQTPLRRSGPRPRRSPRSSAPAPPRTRRRPSGNSRRNARGGNRPSPARTSGNAYSRGCRVGGGSRGGGGSRSRDRERRRRRGAPSGFFGDGFTHVGAALADLVRFDAGDSQGSRCSGLLARRWRSKGVSCSAISMGGGDFFRVGGARAAASARSRLAWAGQESEIPNFKGS